MKWIDELLLLFRSRVPVIHATTYDERRILDLLKQTGEGPQWRRGDGIYIWDHADQFAELVAGDPPFSCEHTATVDTVLTIIDEFDEDATFILLDFHHAWKARRSVTRKLRNLATKFAQRPNKNLILLTPPGIELPVELRQDVYSLEFPKPDADELDALLEQSVGSTGVLDDLFEPLRLRIVKAALGLTGTQASRIFRKALMANNDMKLNEGCLDMITEEKCRIIREHGALEFYPDIEAEENVGGLDILKSWLHERTSAFTPEAEEYGLERPRGIALIGIPGTGKSLCAKMLASLWRMPLLRLDMGSVFESLLGHTEQNMREAIEIAELVSPSILWIDEIEKAFAGTSGDQGTATRVLGSFLTWLQERTAPVFVIATANNIEQLSPELLRRGRFDEIFFLDLPTTEERKEIIAVHLRKRGYHQVQRVFDLDQLAAESIGFTGAELEAAIRDAMYPAFADGGRELETDDLRKAMANLVPLARSHSEIVERLRHWVVDGLARNSSSHSVELQVKLEGIRDHRLDGPCSTEFLN